MSQSVPAGFRRLPLEYGFVRANGPLYGRREPDGGIVMAFRVEDRHTNPKGICHGGMLMTFADMVLGFTTSVAAGGRRFLPTINMSCDFVSSVPLGAWIEGRGRVLRTTRNLGFAEAWLSVDEALVLRASGVMKVPSNEDAPFDIAALFE